MSQRYLSRGFGGLMGVLIAVCVQGTALHADTTPPKGAVTAAIGFPPVGTECEYKIHGVKDVETGQEMPLHLIYRVIEDSTHNGRSVHRMRERSSGTILLRDKATGGWTGFVHEGKDIFSFSPAVGFAFPLWVGKSWQTTHTVRTYNQYEGAQTFDNVVWRGKVSAYEDVTVPAGTFKAFKVEGASTLPTSGDTRQVWWYAPELHLSVKDIRERMAGGPLIGPYQKFSSELVKCVTK